MAEPRRRFRFLKELAQGGFGKVYLAEMITGDNFSSIVAIKVLHGKWIDNDEVVMRSRDEARLLGRLRHRNIVRVEDLTSIQGQCAIVMEYLQGIDLKTICNALREQNRVFPRQAAFEVIGAIAAALDAAYNHRPLQGGEPLKVIHRDIKPSNAMITIEGDVKVLDFGTARANFEEREAKTQALAFGSAAYMAPERLMGEEDRPAGDIFSLGVTLYELLTLDSFGKIHIRPERFEKTVAERLAALDLSSIPESEHESFRETMRLMLGYEPETRPTATEVVELMEAFSERARDGGLKRFARETVKDTIERHIPEQDPNDPLTGSLIYEDSGGFATPADASDATSAPQRIPAGSTTTGASNAMPRANPRAAGAVSSPRPVAGNEPPAPVAAPVAAPAEDENPFHVPEELAEPPVDLPSGRPGAGALPPTPPSVNTVTPRAPETARVEAAPPRPKPIRPIASAGTPEPAAPSGGGMGKILVGLLVLGALGAVAVGGALVVLGGSGDTTDAPADPPQEDKVLQVERRDYIQLAPTDRPRAQSMRGFDAIYTDIVDYIVRCTHRIWDERDI
ncbi:MAG: protein kinase domain-containing protein, partial [Myxococcota bacterium]